jgi:autotransporter-associated beta strand protein
LLSLCVWDGGGNNNHWSNPANWWAGLVPDANDDLVFRGTALTQTENDLPSGTAFRSLSFLSNDFSVAGNSLAVTNRIFVGPGASETTIAAEVGLNGTVHATLVGGSLLLSGGVSGSGSLSEDGIGILILGAGASYTGTTMIQRGATLQLGAADALPSGPTAGAVKVNGTLDLAGYSATVDGLSGHGLVTSSAPGTATLTVDTTGYSSTFWGVIQDGSGQVGLTTEGTGTLTLRGDNTFTGAVTIDAGSTLRLGSANALPGDPEVNGTLDLAGNSTTLDGLWGSGLVTSSVAGAVTLTVDTTNYPGTFSGVIENGSGTMALTKTGSGTLALTGTNTYSGGTTISAGTLQVGDGSSNGTLGSGSVVDNAALLLSASGTATIANAISGSGTVTLTSGTIVLTGSNTYSGTTTITPSTYDNVTLQVGNAGTTGTLGSGTVTSSGDYASYAQLVYNRSNGVTVSNAITGAVNVTVAADSTLRAGSSSACGLPNGTTGTGSVTISGTFDLNGYSPTVNSPSGSGTVTPGVSGTATLTAHNGSNSTFSGVIEDGSGTVALTKTGSSDLTLTGTNTYSGGTTISAGTLQVGDGSTNGALGSGSVANNAALVVNASGTTTIANAISGTGTLTQTAGTLILTGANTYSGDTTINDGTLQVGSGGTSGTLGSGEVASGYSSVQLVFDRSNSVTASNDISGYISLVQQGSGTLTLSGSNTYSGGTTIESGSTLRVGSNDSDVLPHGEGSGTLTVNGTLDLNGYSP